MGDGGAVNTDARSTAELLRCASTAPEKRLLSCRSPPPVLSPILTAGCRPRCAGYVMEAAERGYIAFTTCTGAIPEVVPFKGVVRGRAFTLARQRCR
jgi:hypothetical protein